MSDLINRQEAVAHLQRIREASADTPGYNEGFADGLDFCISFISTLPSAQPTVDAVPVIRCEDCIYYKWEIDMCNELHSTAHNVVHEDDYCSRAERRKTDNEK